MDTKICQSCLKTLLKSNFGSHKGRKDNLHKYCKKCRNKKVLDKRWGFSENTKEIMLKEQNYRCAICQRHMSEFKSGLAVDHDHRTGKIRKLLCLNCNNGLGKFMDNIELLKEAIEYLKNH